MKIGAKHYPKFPVVEFEAVPELSTSPEAKSFGDVCQWWTKRAVDLRWVAMAEPWASSQHTGTTISLAGGRDGFTINVPYEEFMILWLKARGIEA